MGHAIKDTQPTAHPDPAVGDRLDSWKEIALFLKRDVRTVQRWEKREGLPIHRHLHQKRSAAYAYTTELNAWWESRQASLNSKDQERTSIFRRWEFVLPLGFSLLLIGSFGWGRFGAREQPASPKSFMQLTTSAGLEDSPTWSPDGRSVAYASDAAGNLDLYVQHIGGGPPIRLTDSDADDAQPAWSPDGARIAFVSARGSAEKRLSGLINVDPRQPFFAGRNGDIWLMPASGGSARLLAKEAYYPAWSPDGKEIVYAALREGRWHLRIQEVDGASDPRVLVPGSGMEAGVTQPAWSPDGKWIAFAAGWHGKLQIYAVPSRGGEPSALITADGYALMPSWSPDGGWLFFTSDRGGQLNVWKARFEDGRTDEPIQVTAGSGADLQARPSPDGKRLVFSSLREDVDLWQYDLSSREATRLTSETTLEDSGRFSPDGVWLAFGSNRTGDNHLWLLNRSSGNLTQVSTASQPAVQVASYWAADGKHLFFTQYSGPPKLKTIWRYDLASSSLEKVYEGPLVGPGIFALSPDNRWLVVAHEQPSSSIVRVELSSGRAEVIHRLSEWLASDPACSPDGEWVAFHVGQGNERKIWLVPFAGGPGRQLTHGASEDSHTAWSADSEYVYFVRNHQNIFRVPRAGGEPQPVTDFRSFATIIDNPTIAANGQRLIFTRHDRAGDLYVVQNPRE